MTLIVEGPKKEELSGADTEGDVPLEVVVLREGTDVLEDQIMARIVGIGFRHRKVREARQVAMR